MKYSNLKAAFIGSGAIMSSLHLPNSRNINGLEPAAIYGRNISKLKKLAREFSIPFIYTDWEKLLNECRATIAVIALPPKLHFRVAQKALSNKAHILLEKPAFLNIYEGGTISGIARKLNRVIIVNMVLRFLPIIQIMRESVEKNLKGPIKRAAIEYSVVKPTQKWYYDPFLAGGGASLTVGIHAVDLVSYTLKRKIEKIEFLSMKHKSFSKIEDESTMNVYFSESEKCTCNISWLGGSFSVRMLLQDEKNLLELVIDACKGGRIFLNGKIYQKVDNVWGPGLQSNALSNLVACVRNKAINMSSLDEHKLILNPLLDAYSKYRRG